MPKSSTTFQSKWKNGPTQVVRVPRVFAPQVLQFARELDAAASDAVVAESQAVYRTAQNVDLKRPVNVASVPQRSPFRYPGGKTWLIPYLRSWLASFDIKPTLFIEPFAGGAIAGLTAGFEDYASHIVLSELDPNVASVWQTIFCGQAEWLAKQIVEFKPTERQVRRILKEEPTSLRQRAFATIVRNRTQRGGIMASGAGLIKVGENGRGLLSRWYPETLAKRIMDIDGIRGKFSFLEKDAFEVIDGYKDEENAVFFVDPPYTVAAKRLYQHWQVDHRELFRTLAEVSGDVLVTYDNTQEIHALAAEFGFETHAVAMKNTHHEKMTELLIGKDLEWLKRAKASSKSGVQTVQATLAFPP